METLVKSPHPLSERPLASLGHALPPTPLLHPFDRDLYHHTSLTPLLSDFPHGSRGDCIQRCPQSHLESPRDFPEGSNSHRFLGIESRSVWKPIIIPTVNGRGGMLSMDGPFLALENTMLGGWRDGSVVKSTVCSSRGREFNSQQPHGGSQPAIMRSGALFWPVGRHGN